MVFEPLVWITTGDHGRIRIGAGCFLNMGVMVAAHDPFVGTLAAAEAGDDVVRGDELPVERELEISELLLGQQIADRPVLRQRAIDDVPTRRERRFLVAPPGVGVGAVEQRSPPSRSLVRRQG